MSSDTVVILAAGRGTRMRSATPKLAHELCGRPLLAWPLEAARAATDGRIVLVVGPDDGLASTIDACRGADGAEFELAIQPEALGTADAVAAAAGLIDRDGVVLVLAADVPLVGAEVLRDLLASHRAGGAAATMLTAVLSDPRGYGRVVRDAAGEFVRVVETKAAGDADERELAISEVNTGIFAFDGGALLDALPAVGVDNAQRERYLPEVLAILRERGQRVATAAAERPGGRAGRQRPRRARGGPRRGAAPHPRAPHARRRDDRPAVEHDDRRRRRRSARTA